MSKEKELQKQAKKTKVAIMGFAPSWELTPFKDESFEVWTLNEAYKLFASKPQLGGCADRWFEIHNRNSPSKNTPEHQAWLKQCPCPVYMQQHYKDIPSSVAFPYKEIIQWFKDRGHIGDHYFTNSISWMIGLALYEGFEEIHVYGVDMACEDSGSQTSEYSYQKPSCEYMLGVAEKYAKVYLPPESELLKCYKLYGFESDNDFYVWLKKEIKAKEDILKQHQLQMQQAQNAIKQHEAAMLELRGYISALNLIVKRRKSA